MSNSEVFISYARSDGEKYANALRTRLQAEAPDIDVWLDRLDIRGGVGWWRQIEEAIERAKFLVIADRSNRR